MRLRFLLVLVILLAACNSSDGNTSQPGLQSANQQQRSSTTTPEPSVAPTLAVVDASTTSELRLQNIPTDLTGDLYLTLNNNLYNVSLEGENTELLLSNAVVDLVRDSMAYYNVPQEDGTRTFFSLNLTNGQSSELFTLEPDKLAHFIRWSPDGNWFAVEIGQIDNVTITRGTFSSQFEWFEVLEMRVYNNDGTRVDLPEPEITDDLQYSILFLTDSTLLVRATTSRVGHLFNLWHVDQFSSSVQHLDIEMGAQMIFSRVFELFTVWNEPIATANSLLRPYGLEIFPPTDALRTPSVLAPDDAFRIDIENDFSNNILCQEYFVMQKPEEELFLPRQLDTFFAAVVSRPFLIDSNVFYLRAVSPSCLPGDFTVELVHITNFEQPTATTLYQADYAAGESFPMLNYVATADSEYLFWSAIESERLVLLLTEIESGETRQVMALPYEAPDVGSQQSGAVFSLLAIAERS